MDDELPSHRLLHLDHAAGKQPQATGQPSCTNTAARSLLRQQAASWRPAPPWVLPGGMLLMPEEHEPARRLQQGTPAASQPGEQPGGCNCCAHHSCNTVRQDATGAGARAEGGEVTQVCPVPHPGSQCSSRLHAWTPAQAGLCSRPPAEAQSPTAVRRGRSVGAARMPSSIDA